MHDAVAAPTTMHYLVVDDPITASVTMPTCRSWRPPLDVDHAVAAPITTPSSPSGIAPQLLLASHQLSMMTMASHHRRRHHADSSCGSFAPPSSHSGTAWPPSSFLRRRPPSRMKSVAPQPTPSQRRSPRTILSWMTSSQRQSPHRLAVDDAVAAPSTTASCRMWRPSLDVDDAFAAQIATTSSPHNGLAPSKPQAASRHHKHPACAATAAGSTRLRYQLLAPPLATPLLLPLAASHSSLFSLLWVLISQEHTHTHTWWETHTHTHFTKEKAGFALSPVKITDATCFLLRPSWP